MGLEVNLLRILTLSLLSNCKTPAILQVKVTSQDRKSSNYFGIKKCFHSDFGINFHEHRRILRAFNGMGESLCVDRLITYFFRFPNGTGYRRKTPIFMTSVH